MDTVPTSRLVNVPPSTSAHTPLSLTSSLLAGPPGAPAAPSPSFTVPMAVPWSEYSAGA